MNKSLVKWGIAGAAVGLGYVLLDALFLERYYFEINTYRIGKKNSRNQIKLALLTDLHFKSSYPVYYKKLAKKVNDLRPDLIIITGDVFDTYGKPGPVRHFFEQLDPVVPKAAILGNHDHIVDVHLQTIKKIYQSHNCDLLINETVTYTLGDKRITVTGVDDMIEGKPSFLKAVENTGHEEHHILLIHSPLHQEKIQNQIKLLNKERSPEKQLNISYIFAGHNHGGQVRFLNFAPVLPKKSGHYVNGWYNSHFPYLYVSKGFGTTALPFRFGARAEVAIFEYGV